MIKKRDIIKYLIDNGFEKHDNWMSTRMTTGRNYCVEVTSRSKDGWTYIFYNGVTDERIEFNRYWIDYESNGNSISMKLNENNEKHIDYIIKNFLRK